MIKTEIPYINVPQSNDKIIVLNPKDEIIPIDVCPDCWNVLDSDKAFCKRCGNVSTHFTVGIKKGDKCINHQNNDPIDACGYCSEPICKDCGIKHHKLTIKPYWYSCINCENSIKVLKNNFRIKNDTCKYHVGEKTEFKCIECGESVCKFCSYYRIKGMLSYRIHSGPWCFNCLWNKEKIKRWRITLGYFKEKLNIKKFCF